MSFKVDDDSRDRLKRMTPKERAIFDKEVTDDFIAILQKISQEKQDIITSS